MYFQALLYRSRWLHAPTVVLLFLLQRTPVLRLFAGTSPGFSLQSGELLKSAFALAALGTVNSVAGATTFNATPVAPTTVTPTSGGVGTTFDAGGAEGAAFSLSFNVTGAPATAKSWTVTGNFPPGITVAGGTAITGGFRVNALRVTLSGTPTAAASQSLTVTAYDTLGAPSGANQGKVTCRINIVGANSPPSFTTHPLSRTVTAGADVTFTTAVTGTPAPTLQWFKGTTALPGQTSATLTLPGVGPANEGDYHVVATNSSAPTGVPSQTATLTVNIPPAITSTATAVFQTQKSGQTFTVVGTGKPAPTFSATGLPAWATLNPTTGIIGGTPTGAQVGTSVVTLTASNGVAPAASQTFSLVVKTGLRLWQESHFTPAELADPAVSGDAVSLAADGLPNLVHYALGHGPRELVPPGALAFARAGETWSLTYVRPAERPGLAYAVEQSGDLVSWSGAGVTHQLVSSAGGMQTWRGAVPVGAPRVFLRLRVSEQ